MKTLNRTKPEAKPTAISLFAGVGGCSLGFGQAGYDVRFANDVDADTVESYRRNFPGTPCEAADIRQLTAVAVLQRIGLKPGELDILPGGPPCQGTSHMVGLRCCEAPFFQPRVKRRGREVARYGTVRPLLRSAGQSLGVAAPMPCHGGASLLRGP